MVPPGHEDVGGARYQVGCIGIAVGKDLSGEEWEILPPLVTSFIDSVPSTGDDYRIGSTEATTVRIVLKGDRSFVQEAYDYGYIPAMRDVVLS